MTHNPTHTTVSHKRATSRLSAKQATHLQNGPATSSLTQPQLVFTGKNTPPVWKAPCNNNNDGGLTTTPRVNGYTSNGQACHEPVRTPVATLPQPQTHTLSQPDPLTPEHSLVNAVLGSQTLPESNHEPPTSPSQTDTLLTQEPSHIDPMITETIVSQTPSETSEVERAGINIVDDHAITPYTPPTPHITPTATLQNDEQQPRCTDDTHSASAPVFPHDYTTIPTPTDPHSEHPGTPITEDAGDPFHITSDLQVNMAQQSGRSDPDSSAPPTEPPVGVEHSSAGATDSHSGDLSNQDDDIPTHNNDETPDGSYPETMNSAPQGYTPHLTPMPSMQPLLPVDHMNSTESTGSYHGQLSEGQQFTQDYPDDQSGHTNGYDNDYDEDHYEEDTYSYSQPSSLTNDNDHPHESFTDEELDDYAIETKRLSLEIDRYDMQISNIRLELEEKLANLKSEQEVALNEIKLKHSRERADITRQYNRRIYEIGEHRELVKSQRDKLRRKLINS